MDRLAGIFASPQGGVCEWFSSMDRLLTTALIDLPIIAIRFARKDLGFMQTLSVGPGKSF